MIISVLNNFLVLGAVRAEDEGVGTVETVEMDLGSSREGSRTGSFEISYD